jgi:peptidoglycan lytic transglycosylase
LADRYIGRHHRQANHGAWTIATRPRNAARILPAAAALTIAGVLVGATGTVMQLGAPPATEVDWAAYGAASTVDPTAVDRGSRADSRAQVDAAVVTVSDETTTASMPPANAAPTVVDEGACRASYYESAQKTASGEVFDPTALTAASKSLPFNTKVRVTNSANGMSVVVRINDRGPYVNSRCLNLSKGAFASIASLGSGVVNVRYEVLA